LAMLLSIQAGYDARLPLSMDGDGTRFQEPLKIDLKGKRIAWAGDFKAARFRSRLEVAEIPLAGCCTRSRFSN
jgi:hypothetical protein